MSLGGAWAFCLGSLPVWALVPAVVVYLPAHLSRHLGLSLSLVGGVWAAVRIADLFSDAALGLAMDRTVTRHGRYRFWMIVGSPILMLGTAMLFFAGPGVGAAYVIGWLLVLYVGASIHDQAHNAWAATLATAYAQRAWLAAVLMTVAGLAGLVTVAIPIAAEAAGWSEAAGVQAMGAFVIVATPLMVGLAVWRTGERLSPDHAAAPPRVADYVALLAKPDLARMALARVCFALGPGCMNAMYLFFARDWLQLSPGEASGLLVAYAVAGFAAAPAAAWLSARIGKHRTAIVGCVLFALAVATTPIVPRGVFAACIPSIGLAGFAATVSDLALTAMFADVADEVRLEQGRERLGLVYALNTTGRKIAAAFAIGLSFPLLDALGYVAREGAVNTPEAILGLALTFTLVPIVFVLAGGLCFVGWRLTAERHAEIRAELERRDAAATAAASTAEPAMAAEPRST